MGKYKYTIVIEQDEDGMYIASCPALQGCYTQGETFEEAVNNIKDAMRLHIEARNSLGERIPVERVVEEVEIDV
ncbi:type II toxin-antitoxin system HicB family antitoxin [bacterium]|nr:type II toxin-antitoxin system HicB family antitoxin [bacterium]